MTTQSKPWYSLTAEQAFQVLTIMFINLAFVPRMITLIPSETAHTLGIDCAFIAFLSALGAVLATPKRS